MHVRVRALDEQGEERRVEASGLEARVIQHELDHLDGVLILDRTTREQRREAMRALREGQSQRRPRPRSRLVSRRVPLASGALRLLQPQEAAERPTTGRSSGRRWSRTGRSCGAAA